jgi:ankyrin repeat protein
MALAQPDVEAKNYFGETALMRASQRGDGAEVNALIQAGADVNARDNSGMTPLLKATNGGHIEILRALIRAGVVEVIVRFL